jgi:hypothetical protein
MCIAVSRGLLLNDVLSWKYQTVPLKSKRVILNQYKVKSLLVALFIYFILLV